MDITKQHIVLNLIRSGRYTLNHETGEVISNIGKEPRILQPIVHYSGYLQYMLDIGYTRKIAVYGQCFSWLAKWLTTYDPAFVIDHQDRQKDNNKPDNLRCITQKDNLQGDWRGKKRPFKQRIRIPVDQKEQIRNEHAEGISYSKLAEKYGISRQTVSTICNTVR